MTARGWRKWSVILICLLPTLIGITMVNLIPMAYNFKISFTDADRGLHNGQYNKSLDQPNTIDDVGTQNYQDLFAQLVTQDALLAFVKLLITVLPIVAAYVIARRMRKRQLMQPDTRPIWLSGLVLGVILWFVLNDSDGLNLLSQNNFFVVLVRSILYVVACMPFFLLVGFVLALILNNPDIRFKPVWRTLLIIPWAVPTYITALIWNYFFRDTGTINQILQVIGLQDKNNPIHWYNDALLSFGIIVLVNVWMSFPFFMTIILTALQSIPADMYEAAEVDGASWWVRVTQITIPMLRPAVLPATVLSSITTFQMFNTVYLITRGGPVAGVGKPGGTDLVMTYAYKQIFQNPINGIYGTMGAFATIVFFILLAMTLLSLRVTNVTRSAYE
jgi:arabinogalactan oligomer/maltooligosaccharide transport system permease protein